MAWTAPRTWVVNEVVTAAMLNAHLRDNLIDLKSISAESLGTFTASTTTYADAGPSVTVPATDTYDIHYGAYTLGGNASGAAPVLSPFLGTTALDADGINGTQNTTVYGVSRRLVNRSLSSGATVKLQQKWNGAGTASVTSAGRWLYIAPTQT